MTSKNIKLPRWANLIQPQEETPSKENSWLLDEDEIREEEVFMRKRCFHILFNHMDQAMNQVLEDSVEPCCASLEALINAAAPDQEEPQPRANDGMSSSSRKRQKLSFSTCSNKTPENSFLKGLNTPLFDQQQEIHVPHDPLLLPVILLEGPSFGRDRRAQVDCLAKTLQKSRRRSAVVQVQLSSQRRFQGMQELVRQLHYLSPILSTEPLHRRIVKRRKKRAISFLDLLLLWAQNVSEYNEIVIFLHVSTVLYRSSS